MEGGIHPARLDGFGNSQTEVHAPVREFAP